MRFDPEKHHRQSIRLRGFDYSAPGAYFVTIVTIGRELLFGEIVDREMRRNEYGEVAAACWAEMPHHFSNVVADIQVVMPNHVHGIVTIESGTFRFAKPFDPAAPRIASGSLPAIVRSYKAAVSRRINALRENPAGQVWQRNYYEHIVRDQGSLEAIRTYIRDNPLAWTTDPENPEAVGRV
ncbi:MAG TPA: transposase [Thermoanaerobaculia bacterium]|nr:transposase [Thermoanaerobaculia bacterium]